jgi:hypothetical protein
MEQFAFFEQRCMETLAAWVWTTGDLDGKQEFGTQAYEDAVHADLFLQRVKELRPSMPTYGWQPRPVVTAPFLQVFREVVAITTLPLKLSGMYRAIKPWLMQQYQAYLQQSDPILEGPTVYLIKRIIKEQETAAFLDWVISKRQDLARAYTPAPKTSV